MNSYALNGNSCYLKYEETIAANEKDFLPFETSVELTKNAANCLYSHYCQSKSYSGTAAKLGVAATYYWAALAFQLPADAFQLVNKARTYASKDAKVPAYADTFQLMTLLRNWAYEMGSFETKDDFYERMILVFASSNSIENYEGYQHLNQSDVFKRLAEAKGIQVNDYPKFATRVLFEYLYGEAFCGNTDHFTPVDFSDLIVQNFSFKQRWSNR
jgi:hypothetical protein